MLMAMLPMRSNKLFTSAVAAAIVANLLAPVAFAADANVNGPERPDRPAAGTQFCTLLTSHVGSVMSKMGDMGAKLDERRLERDARLASRETERQQKVTDLRAKADSRRAELLAKLEDKATTDAQRQALSAFQSAVNAAVTARRAAIDAANEAFRTGLHAAIADRKAKADAAVKAFKTAITAALNKAKADCAAGVDAATVRANLRTATQAALEKLKSDRQAIDKLGDTVKGLVDARRAAHDKAMADFKAAMEKARADLKAAMPEKPAPSENTNADKDTNEQD